MSHIFCGDCGYYSYQKNVLCCTSIKCSCGGIAHVLNPKYPVDDGAVVSDKIGDMNRPFCATDENIIDDNSVDEISESSTETMSPVTTPLRGEPLPFTKADIPENYEGIQLNQQTNGSYVMIQLPFD